MQKIYLTEIYKSVQGESSYAGLPCTFIRLSGCPLRCHWCDTVYSYQKGKEYSFDKLLAEVESLDCKLVELTGGEPLAQEAVFPLMHELVTRDYKLLLETSGAFCIKKVPKAVHIIMDLKCPDSKMSEKNLWSNLDFLKKTDEVKFVIASHKDFLWAKDVIAKNNLSSRFNVLLSPAWGLLKEELLVSWLLESKIAARLNLQIHKYIWSPKKKGV